MDTARPIPATVQAEARRRARALRDETIAAAVRWLTLPLRPGHRAAAPAPQEAACRS